MMYELEEETNSYYSSVLLVPLNSKRDFYLYDDGG